MEASLGQNRSEGTENKLFEHDFGLYFPPTLLFLVFAPSSHCLLVLALECLTDSKLSITKIDSDLHQVFPDGM